jgi:hypothetical protein
MQSRASHHLLFPFFHFLLSKKWKKGNNKWKNSVQAALFKKTCTLHYSLFLSSA